MHKRAFAPDVRSWTAAEIGALAADGALFTFEHGFLLMRSVLDEAEVLTIAIEPAAHRRGYGSRLLSHGLSVIGATTVFLEVAADNDAGIGLYKSLGFTKVGRRRAYYPRNGGPPADALTMRRQKA